MGVRAGDRLEGSRLTSCSSPQDKGGLFLGQLPRPYLYLRGGDGASPRLFRVGAGGGGYITVGVGASGSPAGDSFQDGRVIDARLAWGRTGWTRSSYTFTDVPLHGAVITGHTSVPCGCLTCLCPHAWWPSPAPRIHTRGVY